ncbi:hypothetical protein SLEP1_g40313 [Rubroshorea leprosula]|uniref:Uncharacterized protein n=1 Tax=Rubroshorea leprosula TaxID=152421 RepID=A0AAV5L370_9ROSI|nr:hypothetical protein SLEP1_g40313 [Rubroshorea leprosula]
MPPPLPPPPPFCQGWSPSNSRIEPEKPKLWALVIKVVLLCHSGSGLKVRAKDRHGDTSELGEMMRTKWGYCEGRDRNCNLYS